MAVFSNTAYAGNFSASGYGYDAGEPYTVTASGSLSATLSERADGMVSGTWSYTGTAVFTWASGVESSAVSGSGQVSGTASNLNFISSGEVFIDAVGSLSAGDKSLHLSAGLGYALGSGSASGDLSGNPVIVSATGPAEVVSVPTAAAWTTTASGNGEMTFVSPQFNYDSNTQTWSLASMPASGSITGSDMPWVQGTTTTSHDDYISKAFAWSVIVAKYTGAPSSVQQFLSSASNAATIYDAEASFAKRLIGLLPSVPTALVTDAGNDALQAELESASNETHGKFIEAVNDNLIGSVAEKDAAADSLWNLLGVYKAIKSNSNEFFTFETGGGDFHGGSHRDTMLGSTAAEAFWGGNNDDAAFGWSGNDTLRGEAGADTLSGGAGNDVLEGGSGNDTLIGGTGVDQILFSGNRGAYTVARTNSGYTIQDNVGTDGTDVASSIERLQFADAKIALDISGDPNACFNPSGAADAGQVYRLYQAAFSRAPDPVGLAYWIGQADAAMPLTAIAGGFTGSVEFRGTYGSITDHQFVDQLYLNVLHRPGESAGTAWWYAQLDTHTMTREQVLVGFADSNENQAALIGVIQDGINYTT